MRLIRLAGLLALCLGAGSAAAQTIRTGVWWFADTEFRDRATWALGRDERGWVWTATVDCAPYGATLDLTTFSSPTDYATGAVTVVVDRQSFPLPAFTDPYVAEPGWSAPLTPQVAEALMSGNRATFVTPTGRFSLGLNGSRDGISRVLAECGPGRLGAGVFPPPKPETAPPPPAPSGGIPLIPMPEAPAATGAIPLIVPKPAETPDKPGPIPLITAKPAPPAEAMPDILSATIRDACAPGTAEVKDGALYRGDLTGDGQPDHVLNWGRVTCHGVGPAVTRGAGYCGAAMCSADVYVWPALPPDRPTISILHAGISFFPGEAVSIRTSSSRIGPVDWVWTGTEFTNPSR